MKRVFLLALSAFAIGASAQKTHTVVAKDNPYSIARQYGLSLEELNALNPGVKDGKLDIGQTLIVSKGGTGQISVQAGQSLYGIARQYKLTVDDIKKANPGLNENLQIGDKITLPLENIRKYGDASAVVSAESKPASPSDNATYTVQPGDTYFRITRNYKLTQKQLYELNPGLEQRGLQPGDVLNVSKAGNANLASADNGRAQTDRPTYTVQSGDTVFGILNRFGVTLDDLISLNPQLSGGLKAGMVLHIKGTPSESAFVKSPGEALNVALLLPIGLDESSASYRDLSLDFLSGARLAIERNAARGQKLNIRIVDTGAEANFKKNISSLDPANTDLIIGPFFKSNIVEMMRHLGNRNIPIVSPFANSEDLYSYGNVIIMDTHPSVYAERIGKEAAQANAGEKIYIVAGNDRAYADQVSAAIRQTSKNAVVAIVNSAADVVAEKNMMTGLTAPVSMVLATDDDAQGNAFAARAIALARDGEVKAFSMFYNSAFDKNETALRPTRLVYIMDRKINTDGDFEKAVLEEYRKKYCKAPGKYAVIGFDVLNDMLSRENSKGELYKQMKKSQTQLATKYEFEKDRRGAYINKGYRVVRLVP
ncbi:MAG: LysM peptidoglycan-binding domain-containing protein [Chryseobacterium sp.]|nr:MAG: LysM peptidoglycan-binding domain-containing protein [Chryseobacterium sp.]